VFHVKHSSPLPSPTCRSFRPLLRMARVVGRGAPRAARSAGAGDTGGGRYGLARRSRPSPPWGRNGLPYPARQGQATAPQQQAVTDLGDQQVRPYRRALGVRRDPRCGRGERAGSPVDALSMSLSMSPVPSTITMEVTPIPITTRLSSTGARRGTGRGGSRPAEGRRAAGACTGRAWRPPRDPARRQPPVRRSVIGRASSTPSAGDRDERCHGEGTRVPRRAPSPEGVTVRIWRDGGTAPAGGPAQAARGHGEAVSGPLPRRARDARSPGMLEEHGPGRARRRAARSRDRTDGGAG